MEGHLYNLLTGFERQFLDRKVIFALYIDVLVNVRHHALLKLVKHESLELLAKMSVATSKGFGFKRPLDTFTR